MICDGWNLPPKRFIAVLHRNLRAGLLPPPWGFQGYADAAQ
jgi:hypothetical protein